MHFQNITLTSLSKKILPINLESEIEIELGQLEQEVGQSAVSVVFEPNCLHELGNAVEEELRRSGSYPFDGSGTNTLVSKPEMKIIMNLQKEEIKKGNDIC